MSLSLSLFELGIGVSIIGYAMRSWSGMASAGNIAIVIGGILVVIGALT